MQRSRLTYTLLVGCFAICCSLRNADATVIEVPADQPTIQAGIDAAANGDTVLVAPGTYQGEGNRALEIADKNVVLRSEGGADVTIIDCENETRGLTLHADLGPTTIVEGITIRNGYRYGTGGAGINSYRGSPTIRDCVVEYCTGTTAGGVSISESGPALISGCTIRSNVGASGGSGLRLRGPILVENCTIVSNGALYNAPGGGVQGEGFTLYNCTIEGNVAHGSGGGVFGVDCSIEDCLIVDNYVTGEGGGAMLYRSTMRGCTVTGNHAVTLGGGIELRGGGEIADCLVTGNRASSAGGIACPFDGLTNIRRTTIASNYADVTNVNWGGGGIVGLYGATIELDHTILWGNCSALDGDQAFVDGPSILSTSCSALDPDGIEGDGQVFYNGDEVFTDPLFCDPISCLDAPSEGGDFTLDALSPCQPVLSPCGERIGALEIGCGNPGGIEEESAIIETTTWGRLKGGYR